MNHMSTISFSPDSRTWLLSTPHSSYGLRLDDTDAPCHLHWGARLTLKQLQALPDTYPLGRGDSFGGRLIPEELAVDGGPRYGVPGLQVRFADDTRALEWAYVGHEISEDEGGASLELCMRGRRGRGPRPGVERGACLERELADRRATLDRGSDPYFVCAVRRCWFVWR
jgi:alpha-galactosidase